jgi:glycosyl transferase family 25
MNIKTFVINLKRRTDRKERIRAAIPHILDVEFTSDLGMDVDGRNLSKDVLDNFSLFPWQINSDNFWWNRPLKKGEIGCSLTHLHCWNHIVETDIGISLILEDDIIFSEKFCTKLELILDKLRNRQLEWELLYLGREPLQNDELLFEDIVKPGYSFGTFAYMITYNGARKLLDAHFERSLIPADEFLSAMCVHHPRPDVSKRFKPNLNAYAVKPPLVSILPGDETDSDTENSDFIT